MKEQIFNKNNWKICIKDVWDFPKKGICFKDITPIFLNPKAFKQIIDEIILIFKKYKIDVIVAPESRGFLFASALSYLTNTKFALIRKKGKLPRKTFKTSYISEYQKCEVEIHQDAILKNEKVFFIDDILATGNTTNAILNLLKEKFNAQICALVYLLDIKGLKGKEILKNYQVHILSDQLDKNNVKNIKN